MTRIRSPRSFPNLPDDTKTYIKLPEVHGVKLSPDDWLPLNDMIGAAHTAFHAGMLESLEDLHVIQGALVAQIKGNLSREVVVSAGDIYEAGRRFMEYVALYCYDTHSTRSALGEMDCALHTLTDVADDLRDNVSTPLSQSERAAAECNMAIAHEAYLRANTFARRAYAETCASYGYTQKLTQTNRAG